MTRQTAGWRLATVVLAASFLAAAGAAAGPVPAGERTPVDVRRTTLIVHDVDRELAFWRDALGLTVVYDKVIDQPLDGADAKGGEAQPASGPAACQ